MTRHVVAALGLMAGLAAPAAASAVHQLRDINQDPFIGGSAPRQFVESGGTVFFVNTTPDVGTELWRTDGTEAGTLLVADVVPGPGGGRPTPPRRCRGHAVLPGR